MLFKHVISTLIAAAFVGTTRLYAVQIKANDTSDFGISGQTDAGIIVEAIRRGEKAMQDIFLERAHELSENAQATADWLAGLAKGLVDKGMSKGTAANRKSDASAIFKAVHLNVEAVEMIDGTYHDFVKGCREIVAKANNQVVGPRNVGPKKISDADSKKIVLRLVQADTSPSTALELMTAAQTAYIKAAGTPVGLVRQADRLAIELMKSSDAYYQSLGERISKLTQAAIEHAEMQADMAKKANDAKLDKAKGIAPDDETQAPTSGTMPPAQADTEQQQNAA